MDKGKTEDVKIFPLEPQVHYEIMVIPVSELAGTRNTVRGIQNGYLCTGKNVEIENCLSYLNHL